MTENRSPLSAGLRALLRHRRLAAVLWLASLAALLPALPSLAKFAARWDDGPFRETILKGWDGWAVVSWFAFNPSEASTFSTAAAVSILVGALLHLFLVPGLLRALVADVKRPVLFRVVSESAALLRPNLWGFARYLATLASWEGIVVGLPLGAIAALKGDELPPNGPLDTFALSWTLGAGALVFLNVSLRWSMARVALALGDSPTARGAYRVAKKRLKGARPRAIGIALSWIVAGVALQALFTNAGVALNPATGKGVLGLFLFRQAGFLLLAATRVGYWASLLAFEKGRRPLAARPIESPFPARQAGRAASPSTSGAVPRPEAPAGEDGTSEAAVEPAEVPSEPGSPDAASLPSPGPGAAAVVLLLLASSLRAPADVFPAPVLQGAVGVTFDDAAGTARTTVERIVNDGCLVTGPLSVQLWAASAPVAIGQLPSGDRLFAVGLPPLLPGQFYPAWDSAAVAIAPVAAQGARDVVLVLLEQGANGAWSVRDSRDTGWRFFTPAALLSGGRVSTTVRYRNPYGAGGLEAAFPADASPRYVDDEFAFFWFSDPANAEVYVKALGDNDPDWIQLFAGGTTDFEYTVAWQGCGQAVTFTKPAFRTDGYANGRGIDKKQCVPLCASIASSSWRMSLGNSCGQQGSWKFLQVVQKDCAFSFEATGFAGIRVTGSLSGNNGAFTFVQSGSCTGSGTGTLTVGDGTIAGSFSGTVPKTVSNCCPAGPISGNFTMTK